MPRARVSEFAVSVGANRTLPRTHRRVRRSLTWCRHFAAAIAVYLNFPLRFRRREPRAHEPGVARTRNADENQQNSNRNLLNSHFYNNYSNILWKPALRHCWAANPAAKKSAALPRRVPLTHAPSLDVHRNSGGKFRKATRALLKGCAPGRQANKQTRPAVGLKSSLRVLSRDGGVVTGKTGAWWRVDVPRARCAFVRVIQIRLKFEAACALRLPSAGRVSPPRPTTNFVQKKYLVLERYTSTRRRAARAISDRQGRRSST